MGEWFVWEKFIILITQLVHKLYTRSTQNVHKKYTNFTQTVQKEYTTNTQNLSILLQLATGPEVHKPHLHNSVVYTQLVQNLYITCA